MKSIITCLFALIIGTATNAQTSYQWAPNDSIVTVLDANTYTELKIKQINLTSDTLRLGIRVVYNDLPGSWDGMVCVFGSCLGYIPPAGGTANQAPLITPNDTGYVRLTVNPFSGSESGTLRIRVFNLDNPSDGDTATWVVQGNPLGITDFSDRKILKSYPNPSREIVNIESEYNIDMIKIIGINGQVVLAQSTNEVNITRVDVSSFESGLYMIQAFSNGRIVGTDKLLVSDR